MPNANMPNAQFSYMSQETITLDVGGMKCAGCVKAVERQLTQHPEVMSARVNLATEVAVVECGTGKVDPAELIKKLTSSGFPTELRNASGEGSNAGATERQQEEIRQQIANLVIAGVLILLSGLGHITQNISQVSWLGNIWFHAGLATIALIGPGRSLLIDGWRGWWRLAPNMNTLVGLGATSAYIASCIALLYPQLGWECFFDEPVMMLGFILLGRTLERLARRRAAASLQALVSLKPATARLVAKPEAIAGVEIESIASEIPADRVRVGEYLQVLPGEKIPVDGEIITGKTTIDESMLTGEAAPVTKEPGDVITGGTLNQSGAIVMRATRTGADTTLARIVALVEEAQTRKAPVQHFADAVAGYFTYGVMAIATLTFLFWYFVGTNVWPEALAISPHTIHSLSSISPHTIHNLSSDTVSPLLLSLKLTISVLVIACPCALGLATPTAILVGTGIGAERGLLIRGGDVLEAIHSLDTVVFDKTGTLTAGHPTVVDCLPVSIDLSAVTAEKKAQDKTQDKTQSQKSLLQLAATVESGTNHPLATAILEQAKQENIPLLEGRDFKTEPGKGVAATVNEELVLVGTAEWLRENGVFVETALLTDIKNKIENKTIVYVAAAGVLLGAIAIADRVRADAKATLDSLRDMGLRVMLLTGDREEVAKAIAVSLELEPANVLAGVTPAGKAAAIEQLQAKGHRVAMVGDGINDAPALARADVGISLQGSTDVAVETAGVVLMREELMDVVASIRLGSATFNKIRQNLFWAFAYNTLGIPAAAGLLFPLWGIVLSPATAGALMACSSASVVTNSLILRQRWQ
ncbi:MAG: copper-translocating P-type ATPase [Oscillatoria sp. SIO1A7]|nr:copper-translocating P-type ATPase [Oscillatoria sp. SIO1A7]